MKILNYIRKILAVAGVAMVFSSISTMDYYTKELVQNEPSYLWVMLGVGVAMVIPAIIHAIWSEYKGDNYDVYR